MPVATCTERTVADISCTNCIEEIRKAKQVAHTFIFSLKLLPLTADSHKTQPPIATLYRYPTTNFTEVASKYRQQNCITLADNVITELWYRRSWMVSAHGQTDGRKDERAWSPH
jgi:hypothetical protein